jgi:alcohol dehydrogenase class IV
VNPFDFLTAGQIIFGRGRAEDAAQAIAAKGKRVALVRGSSVPWVDKLIRQLTDLGCAVTEITCRSEPDVVMLEKALDAGRAVGATIVVSVGGGAVIDLGKALAALLPAQTGVMDHLEGVGNGLALSSDPVLFVAIPTTAGTGAEVTKNAVISVPDAGRKVSLRDNRMLSDLAIVDPALTDNAPRNVTLAAGLDAVTQVIEPYLCNRTNALTDAICRMAIPMGVGALVRLERGEDQAARDDMAFVSLCGGLVLANAGLGAVHGLAGVIGGRLGAPHGLICGRLLGPVLAQNAAALSRAGADDTRVSEVANWLGTALEMTPRDVFSELPRRLDDWGLPRLTTWMTQEIDLSAIATEALSASSMRANPVTLTVTALVQAMKQAI